MGIYRRFPALAMALLAVSCQACFTAGSSNYTPQPPQVVVRSTTEEAANLAAGAARAWNPKAVLWYQSAAENGLDRNWARNGRAFEWSFLFANPDDDGLFSVRVEGGRLVAARPEPSVPRESPVRDSFPASQPGIGLAAAAAAALAAGAPAWDRPINYYLIDNPKADYAGRPIWEMGFTALGAIYVIDALTGLVIEVKDLESDQLLSPDELRERLAQADRSDAHSRECILNFFSALDRADFGDAIGLLDRGLTADLGRLEPWRDRIADIERVGVERITPAERPGEYDVQLLVMPDPRFESVWQDPGRTVRVQVQRSGASFRITGAWLPSKG